MNGRQEATGDAGQRAAESAGRFGMVLLIVSLSVLFLSSLIGYLVVRSRAGAWPPPGMPRLPAGLWLSTLLIVAGGVTMQRALVSIRRGREAAFASAMMVTFGLSLAFLASQIVNWFGIVGTTIAGGRNLYAFTFFMLTGLHAAHVVGGLVPMALVTLGSRRRRYTAASHAGVLYCAMYWHFLAVVWLILFSVLYLLG